MCKRLILGFSLLLLTNELQACEIVAYRDWSIRTVQEITKAINDIWAITKRVTYQNLQTRLIAENLLALRKYSKSISLTFETKDFETIYYGRWSNSEEPLLDTQFQLDRKTCCREKLEGERDILAIKREM